MSDIDYDKCPKCTLNPDSMIASCTSEGCPIWKNPIATKDQESLFQVNETKPIQREIIQFGFPGLNSLNEAVLKSDGSLKKRLPSGIDADLYCQPYSIPMTPQAPEPHPMHGMSTCTFPIDELGLFPLGFDQVPVDASKSFFTPKVKTMSLPDGMIAVDAISLRRVLQALNGPMHLIRELQVTRDNPNLPSLVTDESGKPYSNPIDTLVKNFNDSVKS